MLKRPLNDGETDEGNLPTVFDRLESRGIDYEGIKRLVSFDLPHAVLYFESHFGPRSPQQIIGQIKRWRKLLAGDFLLSNDQKADIVNRFLGAELCAWNALIDASFPKLGPWYLSRQLTSCPRRSDLKHFQTGIRLIAVNDETGEELTAMVGGDRHTSALWPDVWREAFAMLGLTDLLLEQPWRQHLVSMRRSQGWPIFTKIVIPRLYDYLFPSYAKPGHVWSEKETVLKRNAFLPKDLLRDMRDILILEYPGVFPKMTMDQLKAVVHRHVTLRRKSTKSAK